MSFRAVAHHPHASRFMSAAQHSDTGFVGKQMMHAATGKGMKRSLHLKNAYVVAASHVLKANPSDLV